MEADFCLLQASHSVVSVKAMVEVIPPTWDRDTSEVKYVSKYTGYSLQIRHFREGNDVRASSFPLPHILPLSSKSTGRNYHGTKEGKW